MADRMAVVGGWDITPSFGAWDPAGAPMGAEAASSDDTGMGHALVLHTHRGGVFTGINSGGAMWGRDGHFDTTAEFVERGYDLVALDMRGIA
jgi:hypothetical protein